MALWEGFEAQDESFTGFSTNPFDIDNADQVPAILTMQQEEEVKEPSMLMKSTFNYNAHLSVQITHMVASGDSLTIVEGGNHIKRFNITRHMMTDRLELQDDVHSIFQDSTGKHLIYCTRNGQETFYHNLNMKKAHLVAKSRGHLVESVGWNKYLQTDSTTGPILLGTSKGIVFETEIDAGDQGFLNKLRPVEHFNELFQLGMDLDQSGREPEPITGLHLEPRKSENNGLIYYIVVATPSRLYQFSGTSSSSSLLAEPAFQPVFARYQGKEAVPPECILSTPGSGDVGTIAVWPGRQTSTPQNLAWVTSDGIFLLQFDFKTGSSKFLVQRDLLPHLSAQGGAAQLPLAVALTEFHVVLLHRDRLELVCIANKSVVCQEKIAGEKVSPVCYMALNPVSMAIMVCREQLIWIYTIVDETRYLWKIYLEKERFELAKLYSGADPDRMNVIMRREAEHSFKCKKFEEAARLFARSTAPFEEVALMFLDSQQVKPLTQYLTLKLASLSPSDKTQQTMLTTWLTEIFLNTLGVLKDSSKKEEFEQTQKEFRDFLAAETLKPCFEGNKATLYELITSHGFPKETMYLAMLLHGTHMHYTQDYSRVVRHHIQCEEYTEAIKVLMGIKRGVSQLYYDFSPALMRHVPRETVEAWMSRKMKLDPVKLIPALVQYNLSMERMEAHNREATRYLEFCVNTLRVTEPAIHNLLISMYVEQGFNEKLINYFKSQGEGLSRIPYDIEYALRLCSEHHMTKACVHIYCVKELYEEAMDLALKVDMDLAYQVASKPDGGGFDFEARADTEELRRKLWLKAAKKVVSEDKDIPLAMKILRDSQVLRLEDILPFFPDFTEIVKFKEAISDSLEDYTAKIGKLETEMKTATESANAIREDIYNIKTKWSEVPAEMKCTICTYPLLIRGFYLFPCQHSFHIDCLVNDMKPQLSEANRRHLESLVVQYHNHLSEGTKGQAKVKAQIDELVASDCPMCGWLMIDSTNKPFFVEGQLEEELKKWA